jgi:hypothetical protein
VLLALDSSVIAGLLWDKVCPGAPFPVRKLCSACGFGYNDVNVAFKKTLNILCCFVDSTVRSTVKKSSQENNNNETNADINGRIEYIDQSIRSVDKRLLAVEKRLSIKISDTPSEYSIPGPQIHGSVNEGQLNEIREKLQEIDRKLATLEKTTHETHLNDFGSLKSQLSSIENRTLKLENVNKITIGKIKVPIEFSGLAAAIVMFVTGFLIYSDHWNIIRSSYYPIAIGLLFCAVVLLKFIMTNRK